MNLCAPQTDTIATPVSLGLNWRYTVPLTTNRDLSFQNTVVKAFGGFSPYQENQ